MKRARIIAGIAIALLLGASFVVRFLQPSPVEVARGHCAQRGFQPENLVVRGFRGSGGLLGIGNRETVEFEVKGANPSKKVVVELRQAVYFLPWQLLEFREEARQ
jgi:hypothetical protein